MTMSSEKGVKRSLSTTDVCTETPPALKPMKEEDVKEDDCYHRVLMWLRQQLSDEDPTTLYDVLETIGSGHGSTAVKRARDRTTGNDVAIKIIRLRGCEEECAAGYNWLILREIAAMKAVNNKPFVAQYIAGYLEQGTSSVWIVQEYIQGIDLLHLLPICSRYSLSDVATVCHGVLRGVQGIHRAGLIHRDLKLANVMMSRRGEVKVIDLGHAVHKSRTTNVISSTVNNIAPEVLRGEHVSHASDIWAVGVMAYRLITGKHPFPGASREEVLASIDRFQQAWLDVRSADDDDTEEEEEARDFFGQCLWEDPLDRPSASHLLKHPYIRKYAARSNRQLEELFHAYEELYQQTDEENA